MKYKGFNITEPSLEMFQEFIKEYNLPISAEEVYNHYKARNWLTKKGTKAKSVEVLCNAWNSIPYNRIGVPKEQSKKVKVKRTFIVEIKYPECDEMVNAEDYLQELIESDLVGDDIGRWCVNVIEVL